MLHIGAVLDRIALISQRPQKGIEGEADGKCSVNILPDEIPDRGLTAARCIPCRIGFPVSVRLYDRQTVIPADCIGCPTQRLEITLEVAPVFLPVQKGHRIEHDMAMQMLPVNVGTNDSFILASQKTLGKLDACRMGLLRRNLPGRIGMDNMVAQNAAAFAPAPLGCLHFLKCRLKATVDSRLQAGLYRVFDVPQRVCQACLFLVLRITQASIQPGADDDDFIVGHYSVSFTSCQACFASTAASWISACVA